MKVSDTFMLCVLSFIFGIIFTILIFGTFKDGQIGVLSKSDIQYELRTNPDSTRYWIKK